ncbi:hypothetical protein ACI8AF_21915 [Blastococcus sp. SYSU D00669]
MDVDVLDLPSAGPEPIPVDTALAAVLGYARGRRPLRFRSPSHPEGRWVQVPAFGWSRFDGQPPPADVPGDFDVLVAEGLHGRLDRASWTAARASLHEAWPLFRAVAARAGGRAFWELPADEFSVLEEPGTVGALLREVRGLPQDSVVLAALHHRAPSLVPHLNPTTHRQLGPHLRESDSGVEAVVHRELRGSADAFAALEDAAARLLGAPMTRLRIHDVLVWLAGSLRLTHAVVLGQATAEWARQPVAVT